MEADTEERYRQHLANLISQTRPSGGMRNPDPFIERCREQADIDYPKGAAAAHKKDAPKRSLFGVIDALIYFWA